jgi:cell division transport system permease protein
VRAQFITSEIGIGLRRNLTMTISVVLVTALSLLAVGTALLFGKQVGLMKGYWYDKVEVSVYLCTDIDARVGSAGNCHGAAATQDQHTEIDRILNANPVVQKVVYESQAEAYEHFKQDFKNVPELVKNASPTALPDSFRVKLKDPKQTDIIASLMADQPGVLEVQDVRKTLQPIFKFLNGMRLGALALAGLALVAALLLTFQTIRVAAFSRRRETGIMRLVGASSLYIQLPFLLEGAIAGLFGAALACGGLVVGKIFLVDHVLRPSISFTTFVGWHEVYGTFWKLILLALVMATGSAFLAIQRHLRV